MLRLRASLGASFVKRLDERHSVAAQDAIDLRLPPPQDIVQPVAQLGIFFAYAERDREDKWDGWIALRRPRELQFAGMSLGEVAGERPPYHGRIYLATQDGVNNRAGLRAGGGEADDVL